MNIFDSKWIVEYECSDGFLHPIKKDTIIVDARSDYHAKQIVKNDPKYHHEYFRICSVKIYDPKDNNDDQEITQVSKPLTEEERKRIDAEILLSEQREKERIKQEKIANQKDKINRINKSPITTGVISGILVAIAFILGWIPFWYWDIRRESFKRIVEDLYAQGKTIEDPLTQEMFLEGVHAKEMRNSMIWIPFVILAVGIILTIILVMNAKKTKPARLEAAKKELDLLM